MSAADIEALPSYPTEEGSGRGITLLTSPMSCTLPFVAFPMCVFFLFVGVCFLGFLLEFSFWSGEGFLVGFLPLARIKV